MPIFEFLEKNAREFPDDIALVEINPLLREQAIRAGRIST